MFPASGVKNFYNNLPKPINSKRTIFTLYGRNGLFAAGKEILKKYPQRKFALLPSYSCGDEIESLINAGFRIEIYKVKADLQCDFEDLSTKLNNKIGLVLITHYFGFPQLQIERIKRLANQHNAILIEDCAHAVGGKYKQIPLGKYGDISIFSLRKFLEIPHGGALLFNQFGLERIKFSEPSDEAVSIDLFIYLAQKNKYFVPGISIKTIYKTLGVKQTSLHGPRLPGFGGYELGLSGLAKQIIKTTNVDDLIRARINNFNHYLNFFRNEGNSSIDLIFKKLPEGVIPSFFPFKVFNSEKLNGFLNRNDLFITRPFWSHLHKYVDWNKYPVALKLKKSMLVLPVTKRVEKKDLKKLSLLLCGQRL